MRKQKFVIKRIKEGFDWNANIISNKIDQSIHKITAKITILKSIVNQGGLMVGFHTFNDFLAGEPLFKKKKCIFYNKGSKFYGFSPQNNLKKWSDQGDILLLVFDRLNDQISFQDGEGNVSTIIITKTFGFEDLGFTFCLHNSVTEFQLEF